MRIDTAMCHKASAILLDDLEGPSTGRCSKPGSECPRNATDDSGTCFGDSGGPVFWTEPDGTEILVGVTSWGDAQCVATGFNYRVDIPETLSFIDDVIASDQTSETRPALPAPVAPDGQCYSNVDRMRTSTRKGVMKGDTPA